ncbi:hypothetical protein RRF57_005643 [Xylaria bambusicola]|uniref:Uncharacterized protein n=1 Tax=Xylaria bambusicola TaxID=326684 RepID=A0AAN7UP39_9PEZI
MFLGVTSMQPAWILSAMDLNTLSSTSSNMSVYTLLISQERPNKSIVNIPMVDLEREQQGHQGP